MNLPTRRPASAFVLYGAVLLLWMFRLFALTPWQLALGVPRALTDPVLKWVFFVLPALPWLRASRWHRPASGLGLGLALGAAYFALRVAGDALFGDSRLNLAAFSQFWPQLIGAALPEEILFRGAILELLESSEPRPPRCGKSISGRR